MQKVWLKFAAKTEQENEQAESTKARKKIESPGAAQFLQTLTKSDDEMSPAVIPQRNKVK